MPTANSDVRRRLLWAALCATTLTFTSTGRAQDPPGPSPQGAGDDSEGTTIGFDEGLVAAVLGGAAFSVSSAIGGVVSVAGGAECLGGNRYCPHFRRSAFVFGGFNVVAAALTVSAGVAWESAEAGAIGATHIAFAIADFTIAANMRQAPREEPEAEPAPKWSLRPAAGPAPLGAGLAGTF